MCGIGAGAVSEPDVITGRLTVEERCAQADESLKKPDFGLLIRQPVIWDHIRGVGPFPTVVR
jgi:hypothetical protein